MRYGIFSDVHANLEAFELVLDSYKKEKIDKFIYLGDVIGYGANPNECSRVLKDFDPVCIAGNHEWAALNKISADYFSQSAKEAIAWTKGVLNKYSSDYLNTFSLTFEEDDFICTHGDLIEPNKFFYISDIKDARVNFRVLNKRICFVGHSHRMGVFCNTGEVTYIQDYEIKLKAENKYIVNVGSVGQPRDGDPRACFCVYDSDKKTISFMREEYDIKKATDKMAEKNLPSVLISRLYKGC